MDSLNVQCGGGGRLSLIWCFAAKQRKYTASDYFFGIMRIKERETPLARSMWLICRFSWRSSSLELRNQRHNRLAGYADSAVGAQWRILL